jgi:hypothetical protein
MPKEKMDHARKSTHRIRHEPTRSDRKGAIRSSHRRTRPEFGREGSRTAVDLSGQTARCFGCRSRFRLVGLIVLGSGVLCCRRCLQRREELQLPDLWDVAPDTGLQRKLTH